MKIARRKPGLIHKRSKCHLLGASAERMQQPLTGINHGGGRGGGGGVWAGSKVRSGGSL